MDTNDKIARASLHIEVADRVRDMIYDRSLSPGQRIDELDLSAKLGTSRTPLREALKVLANEGLVRLAPGRGAYVTELSFAEVDALFPVLAMIEGRTTAEASRRLNLADGRRLNALHQQMEERCAAGDVDGFHQATDELHFQLQAIAANPWLGRLQNDLRRFLKLARSRMPANQSRMLQSLAEHRTLMKAITRNDPDGAEQVMTHHLLAQQRHWRNLQVQLASRAPADGEAAMAVAAPLAAPAAHPLPSPSPSVAQAVPAAEPAAEPQSPSAHPAPAQPSLAPAAAASALPASALPQTSRTEAESFGV